MSYGDARPEVRLADSERALAQQHAATIVAELKELAVIVSKAVGGSDEFLSPDAEHRLIFRPNVAASDSGGIGVFTHCAGGHCIGVYDDATGVCRPCTDADERLCQQPSPVPTPHPDELVLPPG